jgi:hypothetical protein
MMGRLKRAQEQLFYSFRLEEAVPDDHLVRSIKVLTRLFTHSRAIHRWKETLFGSKMSRWSEVLTRLFNHVVLPTSCYYPVRGSMSEHLADGPRFSPRFSHAYSPTSCYYPVRGSMSEHHVY